MSKRNDELQKLMSGLVEQKSKLEALASSYATLHNSKNKNLRSAAFQHFQRNLSLVVLSTQECLDHIDKHSDSLLKKNKMEAIKVIGGILENFDRYTTLQSTPNSVTKQTYNDYFALLEKFLKIHEAVTHEKNVIMFQGDGSEKILFKNLKGQIAYINKLNNNPDNFLPENIQKTRTRANNIGLILNELVGNVEKSTNKTIYEGLLAEAFNDLEKLGIKIMMHEPDDLSEKDKPPQKTDQGLESVLKSTAKEHDKMLKKLRTFNSSLIYRYYASGTPKASEKLDVTISEIKSQLLDESFPNLLIKLHDTLDKAIDNIDSQDIDESLNTYKQIRASLVSMLKSDQEALKTPTVFGHNEIEDNLINEFGQLFDKLKELKALMQQKSAQLPLSEQSHKTSSSSSKVLAWAKKPEIETPEKKTNIESPRSDVKNE